MAEPPIPVARVAQPIQEQLARHISTIYTAAVLFNSINADGAHWPQTLARLPEFINCFTRGAAMTVAAPACPYSAGEGALNSFAGLVGSNGGLNTWAGGLPVLQRSAGAAITGYIRSWSRILKSQFDQLASGETIAPDVINNIYNIQNLNQSGPLFVRPVGIQPDVNLTISNPLGIFEDGQGDSTFTEFAVDSGLQAIMNSDRPPQQQQQRMEVDEGHVDVPEPGSPLGEENPPQGSVPMEDVAAPPQRPTTHTIAAELARTAADKPQLTHQDERGITRYWKERPPEQLVTAMLGTACSGPNANRAAGCFEIPGRTNLPCTDPSKAVAGMCNFKTIAVPWENPVGNSPVFRIYQALDVGAQIKLQLQRALIRYGYAAATLPIYCQKALDRHFSVLYNPEAVDGDIFAVPEVKAAVELAREPRTPTGESRTESTNKYIADLQLSRNAQQQRVVHQLVRNVYRPMWSAIYQPPEQAMAAIPKIESYISRNICPHYSRILPRGKASVSGELLEALLKNVPEANRQEIRGRANTFYHAADNSFVPYPVYYVGPDQTYYPNPAYLNDKYTAPGGDAKRQLMIHRASGMLLRSMQHLRNAMILYVLAAQNPVEQRFTAEQVQAMEGQLLQKPGVLSVTMVAGDPAVPKGAMAFLTEADRNVLIALFRGMLSTFPEDRAQDVFGQITEANMKRDGKNIIATMYKYDRELPEHPDLNVLRTVVYLEALWSYWYDNNTMGKLRRRMNFRAKLAAPGAALDTASRSLLDVRNVGAEYNITADIVRPMGWGDATLEGLVIAHLRALPHQQRQ
ncbi:MAG: hypothetical protein P4L50_10435 [Anaerolineaceae bacterium]|nr:hypothetical protein [Anaerolineaceae bacterium]